MGVKITRQKPKGVELPMLRENFSGGDVVCCFGDPDDIAIVLDGDSFAKVGGTPVFAITFDGFVHCEDEDEVAVPLDAELRING